MVTLSEGQTERAARKTRPPVTEDVVLQYQKKRYDEGGYQKTKDVSLDVL